MQPFATGQGAAYVFSRPGLNWTTENETAKPTASDGAAGDELGGSVSVSADGSTVVAGAYFADVGSKLDQGAAYVFVVPCTGTGVSLLASLAGGNPTPTDQTSFERRYICLDCLQAVFGKDSQE